MSNKAILEFEFENRQLLELMPCCETCKHFQPYALDATEMYCHAPAIVDESGVLFKPPSPDFGCVLHEPKEGD